MNSVSVSGKNWILKRFDQQKISYFDGPIQSNQKLT